MTILIAEDDPLLRTLLTEILMRDEGLEIAGSVATGPECLSAVLDVRPDVLLLDPPLPVRSGLDLFNRMGELAELTAVLVLSDDEAEETALAVARSGARGYLAKSRAITLLPQAIRAIARGQVWFDQRIADSIFREYARLLRRVREQEQPANQLSDREREVLVRVARGLTNNQIAGELFMSVHTVKLHVQHIFRKLNLPNRTEAAVFAVREGLLDTRADHPHLPRHH